MSKGDSSNIVRAARKRTLSIEVASYQSMRLLRPEEMPLKKTKPTPQPSK